MTTPLRRRRAGSQPSYEVLQWRQTWRRVKDGPGWYQEAVVRLADGTTHLYLIRDHELQAA